jgi:protein tyrosine phosphatase
MVWENNSRMVLMMCETTEQKRSKCAHYWPKLSEAANLCEFSFVNGLSVKISRESQLDQNLTERNFMLSNSQSNEKREITQLHFRNWPDHGVPEIESSLGTFNEIIEKLKSHFEVYKNKSPVVVHCSAGVGRTGTIISIYCLNFIYKKALERKSEFACFNIFNIVRQLKEQRRYMVQTDLQYEMIYSYFELFVRSILVKKK